MPPIRTTFVIMAGGRGERLWPLVRTDRPKVCLAADGRRSLLQATIDRLRPAWPGAQWLIVTTAEQAQAVRACLRRGGRGRQACLSASLRSHVLVEPQAKNTAACITLAAVALAAHDPQQVMVVAPADHWFGDDAAFRRTLRAAIRAAVAHDSLATIGIRPTHAHPGLGYLCAGRLVSRGRSPRIFRLVRFIEKPSADLAQRLLRRGRTYWNSGIFVGTADKFLECVTEWLPEHTRRLVPLATNGLGMRRARSAYRALTSISFDHGVMDHLRGGLIVEGRFRWADLGSWDVWAQLASGGVAPMLVGSRNVKVISQGPHLVAAIGVQDLLIVHTPDATLVCPAGRAQRVRELVAQLRRRPELAQFR